MYCCGWTKQERFCHRAPLKRRMTNGERLSILIQIGLFERLVYCLSGRRGVGECKRKSSYSHGSRGNAKQNGLLETPQQCFKTRDILRESSVLLFVNRSSFCKEQTSAHFSLFYCFFIVFLARTRVRCFSIFALTSSPMLCKCLIILL